MKQLTDSDIAIMGAVDIKLSVDKIRIKPVEHKFFDIQNDFYDCHGCTEDQVWEQILKTLYSHQPDKFQYNIISGRSGILKEKIADWLNLGILSHFVSDWKMDNPGSYIIRFKFPKTYEIIKTTNGYKIVAK